MPSQLINNPAISFVCAKPFTYRGTEYQMGDDFPQEEANNIETLVRARFVIPVVDDPAHKPRHWHTHIRTREQAEEYLNRDRVQLQMPEGQEPDSDEVVDIPVLTHPETTPEPEGEGTDVFAPPEDEESEEPAEEPGDGVPDGTITEVKAWVGDDPARARAALDAELAGQNRITLIDWLEERVEP